MKPTIPTLAVDSILTGKDITKTQPKAGSALPAQAALETTGKTLDQLTGKSTVKRANDWQPGEPYPYDLMF